jgi:hypothetical protein
MMPKVPSRLRKWSRGWKGLGLFACLLLLMVWLAYLPSREGGYVWDDIGLIRDHSALHTPEGLWTIWAKPGSAPEYYPLTHSTFWLQIQVVGADVRDFHLFNVFLHALNAFLVFSVLQALRVPGAWLSAILFAVHPIEGETVAWMSQRKTLLSTTFFLSSLFMFVRFRETQRPIGYIGSLLLFALGLLSKTSVVVLPLILLLVEWWQDRPLDKKLWLALWPLWLLAVLAGAMTVYLENFVVKAEPPLSLGLPERIAVAGWIPWFYLYKILLPLDLRMIYPEWKPGLTPLWFMGVLAWIVILRVLWKKRKVWGKAPLVAVGYFLVCLLPVLGFINVDYMRISFVADHFQYLAGIGVITALSTAAVLVTRRLPLLGKRLMGALGVLGVSALFVATWQRASLFADPETLWRFEIESNPKSWMAYANLGYHLYEVGSEEEAYQWFLEGRKYRPHAPEINVALGDYHFKRGEFEKAIEFYDLVLKQWPHYGHIYNDVGVYFIQKGDCRKGVDYLRRGLKVMPEEQDIKANLALALLTCPDPSVRDPHTALSLIRELCPVPSGCSPKNLYILGLALAETGNIREAIPALEEAKKKALASGEYEVVDAVDKALRRNFP